MPLQLLIGGRDGRLTDVSDRAGEPFRSLHLGRGLAVGDFDNDGRVDVLVLNQNQPLVYLHNRTESAGHFIRFRLEGTRSNRDASGRASRSTAPGDDSCPSGSVAAATSRRAIPACILVSGRLPGWTPSRCDGRRDRWIDTAGWTQTWSIGFARAELRVKSMSAVRARQDRATQAVRAAAGFRRDRP